MSLSDRITSARFTVVRLREGYDMSQVDQFLDRLAVAVRSGEPVRPLVDAALFRVARLREGYDMREVDDFLAAVVSEADGTDQTHQTHQTDRINRTSAPDPTPPASEDPLPTAIQEQRGLLSRLFRR